MSDTIETIRVLHVDDDPRLTDLAATFLRREDDRITVHTATNADEGEEILTDHDVDCIVSDYDIPHRNGIEFLESVRELYPDLPFILYTGKGSEEVASEAISAGVSDYLQKESGTNQYTVLANRISNLVSQYRAETRVEEYAEAQAESERYRRQLLEVISDPDRSDDEKIDRLLQLGCERFGVENGHLVMIDEVTDRHEVVSVRGSDVVREGVTDLSTTYCRRTIESDDILDVYHAEEQGWNGDPAYETFGLECYLGGKLTTDDWLFGTLCFVDSEPREPFTHNEKAFFNLLLQWFNQILERRRRLNQAEAIFEHTQDAIFIIDVSDDGTFRIRSVNRAYEELTGLSTADLRGRTPRDLLGEDQGTEVETRYEECVETQAPIEYEERLTLGGETIDLHTRLAPVIEEGTVVQLVGATRDITERKQRERRYDAIFNGTYQFTGLLEPDGTLIEANETALEFGGLEREAVIGTKLWETEWFRRSEETREQARSAVERAAGGEFVRHELPVQGADREAIIDFSVRPVTDEQGNVTLLVPEGRDITDRKEEEHKRQRVIERVTDAIVEVDADWKFTLVNEQAEELYDMDEESLLGRDFWEVFAEARGTRFEEEYRQVMETREPTSFVEYFSQLDGWFDIKAYPKDDGGIAFYFVEVTEQRERQRELEETNQLLSTLFETLPVGVTVLDADGTITRANQRAEEVLGLTESDIIDRTYRDPEWEIFGEDGDPVPAEELPFARVMETGEPVYGYEHGIEWPDGSERWLSINAVPLTTEGGEIEQVVAVITDVTETREYERAIEAQNERLEEFASIVSHDLRNPLTVASGQLELAREECDSDHLDAIGQSIDRMDALITDLLTLAREGEATTDITTVDLADLTENCWHNVDTKEATLVATIDAKVRADGSRLRQLFENLIRNSVEHGGADVTVTVGELADGFYIEDDGPGIPEEDRDDVFETGYSTSEEGTGFGLSIVKGIVDAHDWEIRATEGDGGGARFEITGVETVGERNR